MRDKKFSKRKFFIAVLVGVLAIAGFGAGLHLIEAHNRQDEQYGDSGDWGKDKDEPQQMVLNFDDIEYTSTDDVDAYLVIGTDGVKEGEEGYNGEMADFLTLILIDNTKQDYAFYQIDRDTMTMVDVLDENGESEGAMMEQLCIAHWYGQNADQRNTNTLNTVSRLFGNIPINGYYTLNMADIGRVNHAINGVEVTINEDLTSVDPAFVNGATITLDDEQAEKYIRARMNVGEGTNVERMARQRQYMQNAYNKVMTELRSNPGYISDLYMELEGSIETNGDGSDLSVIADRMINYENIGILTLDGEHRTGLDLDDGLYHSEFHLADGTVLDKMRQVMDINEMQYDD